MGGKRKAVLAGVLVALAGCAAVAPRSPEDAVRARAQERWEALLKGDFSAAYGFLSPGSREVVSEKSYVGGLRKDFWKSAQVEKVDCPSKDACQATVAIEYEFQGRRTKTPLGESWVREGSNWWYVQK
jgi:hypothetical protein